MSKSSWISCGMVFAQVFFGKIAASVAQTAGKFLARRRASRGRGAPSRARGHPRRAQVAPEVAQGASKSRGGAPGARHVSSMRQTSRLRRSDVARISLRGRKKISRAPPLPKKIPGPKSFHKKSSWISTKLFFSKKNSWFSKNPAIFHLKKKVYGPKINKNNSAPIFKKIFLAKIFF